jgi:L-alanine-DL-glutamate epimerase-like enolase superfamily enzyme
VRLEAAGVDIFEQPVAAHDLAGMAEVARVLSAPVLAHETVATVEDALAVMRLRAADILSVSPPRAGGLYQSQLLVRLAERLNFPVMMGGALESGPGTVASLQVAASCRELPFPGDSHTVFHHRESLISERLKLEGGCLELPPGPGLGVTLDEAAVERLRQAPWQLITG